MDNTPCTESGKFLINVKIDKKGFVLNLNQFAIDFFGYTSKNQIIGEKFLRTLSPDKLDTGLTIKQNVSKVCANPNHFKKNHSINILWEDRRLIDNGDSYEIFCIGKEDREIHENDVLLNSHIFDNISDGIIIVDMYNNIVEWNSGATNIFGFNKNEVLGKTPVELFNLLEEDYKLLKGLAKHDKSENPNGELFVFTKKDKTKGICKISSPSVLKGKNGETGIVYLCKTVDKYSDTITSLIESERKFRGVVENAGDGIALIRASDLRIIYANQSTINMSRYSKADFYNKTILDFFADKSYGQKFLKSLKSEKLKKNINYKQFEVQFLVKGNHVVDILVSGSRVKMQGEEMYLVLFKDITLRNKSARKIKMLSSAIDQTGDAVFITDTNGSIIYANKAFERMTGFSKDEIFGKSFNIIVSTHFDDIFSVIQNGHECTGEIIGEQKGGTKFWAHIRVSPVRNDKSKIVNYIFNLEDISGRKSLEIEREQLIEKLQRAYDKLKKLSAMKDEFLAIASHDIRTPFEGVLGFSELLLKRTKLDEQQKSFVEIIYNSAETQLKYVDSLIQVIKLESGIITLDKKSVSINSLICKCVEIHEVAANNKNITIVKDNLSKIKACVDEPKLAQVINNFLSNAIKFTPEGGQIIVSCNLNSDSEIEFFVKDNGIGINNELIEAVFTRYKQATEIGTSGEKGSGLGLAISKNIIELHGGRIGATSKQGEGSTFYFVIPAGTTDKDDPELDVNYA